MKKPGGGMDSVLPVLGAGKMCSESQVKTQELQLVTGGLDSGEICTQLHTQL